MAATGQDGEMSETGARGSRQPGSSLLERMIRASGAKSADRVTILGHEHFDLLVGLCRRGYVDVSCQAAGQRPHCSERAADILWIPSVPSHARLRQTLQRLSRDLRPDGVLVLRDQRKDADVFRLRKLLAESGFEPDRQTVGARVDGLLLCARKRSAVQMRRAA
jgi:hypothetical protein